MWQEVFFVKKGHLFLMLDIAVLVALFRLAEELPFPYPRTLSGFWAQRQWIFRTLATMLWLGGLWFDLYQVRDKAEHISSGALLSGMALALSVVLTHYATFLILQYKARLVFQVYGGWALLSAGAAYLMLWLMEKPNADLAGFDTASRKVRWTLAVAFGILAAGMIICCIRYRQVMWYAVTVAAAWLFVAPLTVFKIR